MGAVGGVMSGAEFSGTSEPCPGGGWPEVGIELGNSVLEARSTGPLWPQGRGSRSEVYVES